MKIENWFVGVVEETADPMSAGRVRVRCFSYHTPDHELLPTENLIWAQCVLPVDNPGIGGIGAFAVGLVPGSWVLGFFRDGNDMQDPVIMGGFSGSTGNSVNYQDGFGYGDPHGAFKYSSAMNNFPSDSNTFASTNGYSAGLSGMAGSMIGGISGGTGGSLSSYSGSTAATVELTGNGIEDLIAVAQAEVGNAESPVASNQGPIAKYWDAVGWDGAAGKQPWCAAFVSWCVRESGIIPEPKELPATAGVSAIVSWAKRKPFMEVRRNPRFVRKGDLFTLAGGWSHIGIAITDNDPKTGKFQAIDGNGPKHSVMIRTKTVRGTKDAMSFNVSGEPLKPKPSVVQGNFPIQPGDFESRPSDE